MGALRMATEDPQPEPLPDLRVIAAKAAITMEEAELLGYGCPRHLRRLIVAGRLVRCVLHVGRRGIRLHQPTLIEELRSPPKA